MRLKPTLIALFVTACWPMLAMAQDEPTSTSSNWFEAFIWSTKSPMLGNLIVVLLLIMSAVVMGYSLMLIFKFRRDQMIPEATRDEIEALLAEKKYREAIEFAQEEESYLGQIACAARNEAANGYSAMERAVEETGDAEAVKLLRPIEYLNVLGNIAPMIGLFGTVFGMIVAFQKLVEGGGSADPVELAGGISTALVTTFWGLVVAIPALSAYSLIRNKVDAQCAEGLLIVEELISPFKPSGKKKKPSSSSTSSSSPSSTRATPKPE